jgi:hypothetical protein
MPEQQLMPQGSVTYYFLRSKDVHEEDGTEFITLFARLIREFTFYSNEHVYSQRQSVWVDIDEVESRNAPEKVKELPNAIQTFKIQEKVFNELVEASKNCPKELYFVTPMSLKQKSN